MNHINIAKLNAWVSFCIKNLANCIFRANHQIFDLPIIPRIYVYTVTHSYGCCITYVNDDNKHL